MKLSDALQKSFEMPNLEIAPLQFYSTTHRVSLLKKAVLSSYKDFTASFDDMRLISDIPLIETIVSDRRIERVCVLSAALMAVGYSDDIRENSALSNNTLFAFIRHATLREWKWLYSSSSRGSKFACDDIVMCGVSPLSNYFNLIIHLFDAHNLFPGQMLDIIKEMERECNVD